MSDRGAAPAAAAPRRSAARPATWWGKAWVRAVEEAAYAEATCAPAGRWPAAGRRRWCRRSAGMPRSRRSPTADGLWTVDRRGAGRSTTRRVEALVEAVAAAAGPSAALLAGDLPHELVEHADEAGVELLPFGGELATDCTCEAWAQPCPHALAVLLPAGLAGRRDPYVLLHLRGLHARGAARPAARARAASAASARADELDAGRPRAAGRRRRRRPPAPAGARRGAAARAAGAGRRTRPAVAGRRADRAGLRAVGSAQAGSRPAGRAPPRPSRRAARASRAAGSSPLCGVELIRPNAAWAIARARLAPRLGGERPQLVGPQVDVLALQVAHPLARLVRAATDQSRSCTTISGLVPQGELDVPVDERRSAVRGSPASATRSRPTAEQLLADRDQHLGQDGVLGREVLVERRAGDAARGAEVGDRDPVEATLGEQLGGGGQDLLAAGHGLGAHRPRLALVNWPGGRLATGRDGAGRAGECRSDQVRPGRGRASPSS